ncbi:hypothetical protein LXL04_039051 [Taraxacum kok-saghyz]
MPQEIKVKVSMHCQKCRKEVMKIVTKLPGVDQVSVDLQKEMLVVIGDVDPVCVATSLRKKQKVADIVSVGPYKKKDKDEKKPIHVPMIYWNTPCYDGYRYPVYGYPPTRESGSCNLM